LVPPVLSSLIAPIHSIPLPFIPATPTPTSLPIPTATSTTVDVVAFTSTTEPPLATSTLSPTVTPTLVANTPTLENTPLPQPTPLGGGSGQIAFASNRSGTPQIYLSNVDGSNVTPLTSMEDGACQPAWSPNGRLLVFISPCPRRADFFETVYTSSSLYLINADGTNITQLTNVPGADFDPAWSPDGKRIAFASMRDGGKQIYTLDSTSLAVTRLTNTSVSIETSQPVWSPDGTMIAYMVKRVGTYQVWVMDDTGQKNEQVVRSGQTIWDFGPVWAPDGKTILFSERRGSGFSPPWLMSVNYPATGDAIRLNQFPAPIEDLQYSPDGLWLVSEGTDATGNRDIYFMTITGGSRTRLTTDEAVDFDPAWRPLQTP